MRIFFVKIYVYTERVPKQSEQTVSSVVTLLSFTSVEELIFEEITVMFAVTYTTVHLPCTDDLAYFFGGVGKVFIPTNQSNVPI